jgi:hypothetical protein
MKNPNKMNGLKAEGWLSALYIETNFIEYFATPEDALRFAKEYYENQNYFVKPVTFFSYTSKKSVEAKAQEKCNECGKKFQKDMK